MGMGFAVHQILTNGGTSSRVNGIRVGELKQQELYPVLQINDFATPENCKDGTSREVYTVTVVPWAAKQWESEEISGLVRNDLLGINPGTYNGLKIRTIQFVLRGPWLRDDTKKYWGRPLDFEVSVDY